MGRFDRRSIGVFVCVAVAVGLASVVLHDLVQSLRFDAGMLCERTSGSFYRSASGCSTGNDPACRGGECETSEFVSERARRSDTWILFNAEMPRSGSEPFYPGVHVGSGHYVDES